MTDHAALPAFADALADAVARAGQFTVAVHARRRLPASGVAWSPGVVVTADHVIEREEDLQVTLPDGTTVPAAIAGRDPGSDLAVLRVSGALTLAEHGGPVRVGHPVLAIGRPGTDEPEASLGLVTSLGGPWRTRGGLTVDGYIQSGVTMYPGFSGGPLIDAAGSLIGVTSSHLGRGSGLAIPAAAVGIIVDALLRNGRIRRGYLGVSTQTATLAAALAAKADGRETGLLVVAVEPGSPAEAAGVLVGDILVALDDAPIAETGDLHARLGPDAVGRVASLAIIRGGEAIAVGITIGERD